MSHHRPKPPLCISSIGITIHDPKRRVEFAELKIGGHTRGFHSSVAGLTLSATFDPVVEVIVDQFSLSVHCRHNIMGLISQKKLVDLSFTRDKILHRSVNRDGKREFHETQGKMTIVIEIWQLRSTVDAIVRACPRFRLLVLGQFISKHMRGDVDINKQLFTTDNSKFVLHDGGGFESGDGNSVSIVKDFIARRLEMPDLEDKLHAIWLCIPIPRIKECLLESGVQDFLRSRKQVLGRDIPIVVVLTQFDLYDAQHNAMEAGQILEDTKKTLRQSCVEPLEAAVDSEIPHVVVFAEDAIEDTVQQLVDVTTTNVDKYVAGEAALVAMMAQQVDIGLKIKASIVIGKKRHWKCLAAGTNFTGYTMWECLSAIHADIIDIWNFDDPHQDLLGPEFKQLLLRGLDNVNQLPDTTNASDLDFGLAVVSAIVDILTPHDFAPSVSATTGVVTPAWAHEIYRPTNMTLSRIMTYIVDLTCTMQILFLLAPKWSISCPVIKLAMMAYDAASKNHVHAAIQSSVPSVVSDARLERDHALNRIIEVIEQYSIKASKAQDLRAKIIDVQRRLDDEWVWV
ncbi:uncharacterized protein BJ212DRAFT_1485389 [Suillus subaureus]|uniref:Uncharacterized protein n=1 Tax=Suillus subaureus TaxID=48587 RepID=A0A9P7E0K5_9AGAM|nr:uncharacterized protein BJ212DRAFT_1485389 [Suillus subaureus]KAG1807811.1 hypothetical protein BJ212DRAFT_1485389 [Suillus subaureus]